jgi:uncharacterized membrane protein
VRRSWWLTVVFLSAGVALYAIAVLLLPHVGPPFVTELRARLALPLSMHLAGGSIALATGAWQLNTQLRARRPSLHRWIGRVYVVAVLVGGLGAALLAPRSQEGIVTHWGFGVLAVAWLGTTGVAYRAIRRRDQASHRRWMLRSYALTFAAVTLRIYLPLSQVVGLPYGPSYQVISWLCWVPNLLLVELLVVDNPRAVPIRVAS